MQARPAAGARAGRVLAVLLALGLCATAHQDSPSMDLNHDVTKRSTNDSNNFKSDADRADFLGDQVMATEDSISANENVNSDQLIRAEDRSGRALPSAVRELDAALSIAQAAAEVEQRAGPAQPDPHIERQGLPEPDEDRHTLKVDSNTYDLSDSSLGHELNTTEASAQVPKVENRQNSSRPTEQPESQRRASNLYETGYNTINNNWQNLYNPYDLQLNAYANTLVQAEHLRNYGNQAALFQNPGILKQNFNQRNYPIFSGNSNPYYTQNLNQNPIWSMQASPLGNTPYTATSGLNPRALFQTQLNPYLPLASSQGPAIAITNPSSSYSRKLIPRSELLYLERFSGSEDILTCSREGEIYNLRTPWEECLICACVREGGRVQPVCANCAGCERAAHSAPPAPPTPFDIEGIPLTEPKLLTPVLHPEIENLNSGPTAAAACAPLPFEVPFEHPMNPCRICVCQKKNVMQDEVFVSCIEDPQCVKPLELPVLPSTPIPPAPIPTPLCNKFPQHVEFPHPTEPCQVCRCLQRAPPPPPPPPAPFAIPDHHILCAPDYSCALKLPSMRPSLLGQGSATSFEPDQEPKKTNVYPSNPVVPKVTNPSDLGPEIQLDSYVFEPDSSSPPSPGLIDVDDSLLLSPDKPAFAQNPPNPGIMSGPPQLGFIPKLPQRAVSEFTVPQAPPPQFAPEIEKLTGNAPVLFPQQLTGLKPELYPSRTNVIQPLEIQKLPQQVLPWPPITILALHKPEHGPLLGPPPHQSCQPYPTNTPFQHPWDECQLCVCAEFASPGHVSVEVNCYTKSTCCLTPPPVSSSSIGSGQVSAQATELQILDSMCEQTSLSVEFASPHDACQVCSCELLGKFVVPVCRSTGDALCKGDTAPAPPSLINYVERKCRHQSPDKPFVSECSVCVCHIVFTFIIAKCTPQPKCLQKLEHNPDSGTSYNQPPISSLHGYQTQTLLPSGPYTANMNALNQLQRNDYYANGQNSLSQLLGYRPELLFNSAQNPASFLNTYQQNSPISNGYSGRPELLFNSAQEPASFLNTYQQNSPISNGYSGRPELLFNSAQEPASFLNTYQQNSPISNGNLGIARDVNLANAQALQSFWSGQQTPLVPTNAPSTTLSQPIDSAEAFIETINSEYQKNSQLSSNAYPSGYLQSQSGPDLNIQASSMLLPSNDYGHSEKQSLEQNFLRHPDVKPEYLSAQANAEASSIDNVNSRPKTYLPYTFSLDLKQLEAVASSSNDASPSTYNPISDSYSYLPQKSTFYPPVQPLRDSSTLAYDQGDANARGLLAALSGAGADGALVTRTGRGQCAYAGDVYHRACRACYCFADDSLGGELYSMCLGKPCH